MYQFISLDLELIKPTLKRRVEAKIVNELLEAFMVLRLGVVKGDLDLRFALLVLSLEWPCAGVGPGARAVGDAAAMGDTAARRGSVGVRGCGHSLGRVSVGVKAAAKWVGVWLGDDGGGDR